MAKDFIITKEHRRFTEFATAVRKERTIGICHGDAGIGKTQSGSSGNGVQVMARSTRFQGSCR